MQRPVGLWYLYHNMPKRHVLNVFALGGEHDANGVASALNFLIAWSTVQEQLRACVRQKLLHRRWDGVRYLYVLTEKGAARLEYWQRLEGDL